MPVLDLAGNKALFKVWIVYLGAIRVTHNPPLTAEVKTDDAITMITDVQKELVDPEWWKGLQRGPAKQLIGAIVPNETRPRISQI